MFDPPRELVSFFIIKPSTPLNEIIIYTLVDGLFVQILTLNFTEVACLRQAVLENNAVLRILDWVGYFSSGRCVGLWFYSITEYLPFTLCQHWCRAVLYKNELTYSSTHTLYYAQHTHNSADTVINVHTPTHKHTHIHCGISLFIQLGQAPCMGFFPLPIWCVKSGRKSKSFPSFWLLWVVVPRGSRGDTGSKASLGPKRLGSGWSSTVSQKQQRKVLLKATKHR